jgi:multimeric flavodoxin WrbA
MKVIGINGSPRGSESRTARLVRAVLKGAEENGAEIEFIDLCNFTIEYCTGCGVCYAEGECIHDDDFPYIYEKMMSADGIVLGSPVYLFFITAQLKTIIDRLADAIHCQVFTGKYGCAVATSGSTDEDTVVMYLNNVLFALGATTLGGVGRALGENPDALRAAEEDARMLGRSLADAIGSRTTFPEQEAAHREMRKRMKALVEAKRDIWHSEYEYWQKREGFF